MTDEYYEITIVTSYVILVVLPIKEHYVYIHVQSLLVPPNILKSTDSDTVTMLVAMDITIAVINNHDLCLE